MSIDEWSFQVKLMIVQNDSNPLMLQGIRGKKLINKKNGEQIFSMGRFSVVHLVLVIP